VTDCVNAHVNNLTKCLRALGALPLPQPQCVLVLCECPLCLQPAFVQLLRGFPAGGHSELRWLIFQANSPGVVEEILESDCDAVVVYRGSGRRVGEGNDEQRGEKEGRCVVSRVTFQNSQGNSFSGRTGTSLSEP
jgi:hypothetical protein